MFGCSITFLTIFIRYYFALFYKFYSLSEKKIIISFKLAAIHQEQYNQFYGSSEMKLKVLESIGLAGSKNLRGGYGTIE